MVLTLLFTSIPHTLLFSYFHRDHTLIFVFEMAWAGFNLQQASSVNRCASTLLISWAAPARKAIEFEVQHFETDPARSPYAGLPSPSLDAAWHNLLQCKLQPKPEKLGALT